MNLLLVDNNDFTSQDEVTISGRRFLQLKETIKPECGDTLRAGLLGGLTGVATLLKMDDSTATLRVEFNTPPPPPGNVELICALPRPQTFRKVLHCAVTMGVKKIRFIHARKVEKSYWQSSMLRPEEIDIELRLALEQCGDTVFPQLEYHNRFKIFAEDVLPEIVKGSALSVFGHPRAVETIPSELPAGTIQLAVGPEGGFTDYENMMLEKAGMLPVTLGNRVLRTEFALAALLAKLS